MALLRKVISCITLFTFSVLKSLSFLGRRFLPLGFVIFDQKEKPIKDLESHWLKNKQSDSAFPQLKKAQRVRVSEFFSLEYKLGEGVFCFYGNESFLQCLIAETNPPWIWRLGLIESK